MPAKPSRPSIESRIKPVSTIPSNQVILVYGRSGTGKTHFGSTFPKPILYIDLREGGLATVAGTDDIEVIECERISDVDQVFEFLKYNKTPYQSVILDQVTSLQDMYIEDVRRKAKKGPNDLLHRKHWGTVSGNMKQMIDNFKNMKDKYNICFIAHERIFGGGDEEEEDGALDPSVSARVMPSVASFINGAVDVIGSTFIRETMKKVPGKLKKERVVDYCMRVGPHAIYATKIRRPKAAGPVPMVIVDPTYAKIIAISSGKSTTTKKVRK